MSIAAPGPRGSVTPMPRAELRSWDVLLAVVGTLAVVVEGILRGPAGLSPAAYALTLVAGAPLAFRTRVPLAALVAVEAGAVVCSIVLHANWTVTGSFSKIRSRTGCLIRMDSPRFPVRTPLTQ